MVGCPKCLETGEIFIHSRLKKCNLCDGKKEVIVESNDKVENVSVSPGSNVVTQQGGSIYWSIYDMFTVETTP